MSVAKSYQTYEIVSEIFDMNNKPYVKVKMPSGIEKTVRWYTEEETRTFKPYVKRTEREALGFGEKGYITVFKGNTYPHLEWFRSIKIAKYNKTFNWLIPSTEELPDDIPADLTPIQIYWENVGDEEGSLFLESKIRQHLDSLLFDKGTSQFIGTIGERREFNVIVTKKITLDKYGYSSVMYIFEDKNENVLVWTTSAYRNWSVGDELTIKATIKAHKTYQNTNQTILTRCI